MTAQEVRLALSQTRKVARNTVRTLLERMEDKGWLKHRSEGRTFLYTSARPRHDSIGQKVREIVETVCGGSPETLVTALLDYRRVATRRAKADPAAPQSGPGRRGPERRVVMSSLIRCYQGDRVVDFVLVVFLGTASRRGGVAHLAAAPRQRGGAASCPSFCPILLPGIPRRQLLLRLGRPDASFSRGSDLIGSLWRDQQACNDV